MRHKLPINSTDTPPLFADPGPGVSDMLRNASKLARLATELLQASAASLEGVMALARQGVEESSEATASLSMILRRLETNAGDPGWKPVSECELSTATAKARQLMLRSGETVVRMRMLIDGETISERYRWSERRVGATMVQLLTGLDELAHGAASAVAGWPIINAEVRTVERGIYAMRDMAYQHRSVADQAMQTASKLQEQATHFVRILEQAHLL